MPMTAVASQDLRSPAPDSPPTFKTLADVLRTVGDVPAHRVWLHPTPGTATVQDVVDIDTHQGRICELVDGILVEKATGMRESLLAAWLASVVLSFVRARNLGLVAGADGMLQPIPGMVRIPDACYISWTRMKGVDLEKEAAPLLAPELAIEVVSPGNTAKELARKRREYIDAGVLLLWVIDARKRSVTVTEHGGDETILTEADVLDGRDVLPGFSLPVAEIMREWDLFAARP